MLVLYHFQSKCYCPKNQELQVIQEHKHPGKNVNTIDRESKRGSKPTAPFEFIRLIEKLFAEFSLCK
jgi:hypothetical protein